MRKVGNFFNGLRALSLVAILGGCISPTKNISNKPPKDTINHISLEVVPFALYDPRITESEERESNKTSDKLEINFDDYSRFRIKNYLQFRDDIYRVAGEVGYTVREVRDMHPRETVELICKMVARRVDYFGISQDYDTKSKRKGSLAKMKSNLSSIINNSNTPDTEKSNAESKMRHISELERRWDAVEMYERMLSLESGFMVTLADELSADELFKGDEPVVCRHYSTICEAVFFVLKEENTNLKDTHVSSYCGGSHRWNKITTLIKSKNGDKYTVSFFDPTWYDLNCEIEGYDSAHFPDTNMLQHQIKNFPGENVINPPLKKH